MIPTAFGEVGGLAVGLPSPAAKRAGPVCTSQCITEVENGQDRWEGHTLEVFSIYLLGAQLSPIYRRIRRTNIWWFDV